MLFSIAEFQLLQIIQSNGLNICCTEKVLYAATVACSEVKGVGSWNIESADRQETILKIWI